MLKNTVAALALVAALAGCAGAPGGEHIEVIEREAVTWEMLRSAQEHAVRLSGGALSLSDAPDRITVMLVEHEALVRRAGGRKVHAAILERHPHLDSAVLWLDESRPWQSDPGHTFGILTHEVSHAMGADECQAHTIQSSWLEERGDPTMAGKVRENGTKLHGCTYG